jgi:hypothetical protein
MDGYFVEARGRSTHAGPLAGRTPAPESSPPHPYRERLANLCFAAVVPCVAPTYAPCVSTPAPELSFAPAADTSLTFTLRHRSSVALEEGSMTMFGKKMPMGDAGMEHVSTLSLKFDQAYGEHALLPTRTLKAF